MTKDFISTWRREEESPRTNTVRERFRKTILSEFYQLLAFLVKIHESIEMRTFSHAEMKRAFARSAVLCKGVKSSGEAVLLPRILFYRTPRTRIQKWERVHVKVPFQLSPGFRIRPFELSISRL